MELGKRITEIRKENNMTQEELAEKFHVTRQTISNWENGKSYPDIETLVHISNEFNVSLDMALLMSFSRVLLYNVTSIVAISLFSMLCASSRIRSDLVPKCFT